MAAWSPYFYSTLTIASDGNAENVPVLFNFATNPIIQGGDTIVSSPAPVLSQIRPSNNPNLTLTVGTVTTTTVTAQISVTGGYGGQDYQVSCEAHTAAGNVIILTCVLSTLGGSTPNFTPSSARPGGITYDANGFNIQNGLINPPFDPVTTPAIPYVDAADLPSPSTAGVGALRGLLNQNQGIVVSNGSAWLDISCGEINSLDFGLSSSEEADNAPIFNAMLTAAAAIGNGGIVPVKIRLPGGSFIIDSNINWQANGNNITIEGKGSDATILIDTCHGNPSSKPGNVTTPTFNITATDENHPITNLRFEGFTLQGAGNTDASSAYSGFALERPVSNVRFQDVKFRNFRTAGIHLSPIYELSPGVFTTTYGDDIEINDCEFDYIGSAQMNAETSGGAFTGAASRLRLRNTYFGPNVGMVPGIATSSSAITNVAISGNVATITTNAAHGFVVGNYAVIAGLTNAQFNGRWLITNVGSSTMFSFALAGSNMSANDTGTATLQSVLASISNVTYAGGAATITCTGPHGFTLSNNNVVSISGLTNTVLNGNCTIATLPSSSSFTFVRTFATAITQVSYSGGAGTISTGFIPHNLIVGNQFTLSGLTNTVLNSASATHYTVATVPSATSFTFTQTFSTGITQVALTNDVATITTGSTHHNLIAGNVVAISGLTNGQFNGTWTVTNPVTATSFSFALVSGNVSPTSDTGTVTLSSIPAIADSGLETLFAIPSIADTTGTAVTPGNNFHGAYINAICGFELDNCDFEGLCSRLHAFSTPGNATEPPVDYNPPRINARFNGQYGGSLSNVVWHCVAPLFNGCTFQDAGVNIGCTSAELNGCTFLVDANCPTANLFFLTDGVPCTNVVIRSGKVVSTATTGTTLATVMNSTQAGSGSWTLDDLTVDGLGSDAIALATFSTGGNTIHRCTVTSDYNGPIIRLAGALRTNIHDNVLTLNTSGAVQPILDTSFSPTNLAWANRINCSASGTPFIGPSILNWDGRESDSSQGFYRQGQRCYRNLAGSSVWTPGTVAPGGNVSTTVPVVGVVPGNVATAEFGAAGSVPFFLSARVTAPGTVTVWGANLSGSTETLTTAGNLRVNVRQMWPDWQDGTTASVGSVTLATTTLTPTGPSATLTATVTLSGGNTCNIGDAVAPTCTAIGSEHISLTGYVSAPDTVIVTATNLQGVVVTLASPTISVQTRPV